MDFNSLELNVLIDTDPDQSCSQCGTRDIQLAPLQREVS